MRTYQTSSIDVSPFEPARFGVSAARAFATDPSDIDRFDAFCRERSVEVLILRCETSAIDVVHRVECTGGNIMDCLVYYRRDLSKELRAVGAARGMVIRPVDAAQADAVAAVAARAFEGYYGHYHADERFDRSAADATYKDWAARSCRDVAAADIVLAAFVESDMAGFITLKRQSSEEVEIVLNGVDPAFQGRGIYGDLVIEALRWAQSAGARSCVVSTQLNNVAVQKVWVRNGFEPTVSYYTFHKWYVPNAQSLQDDVRSSQ